MRWIRRLWYWNLDGIRGATWWLRYTVGSGDPQALTGGDKAPVLLIPGVYETWRYLTPPGRRLHAVGHPVHVLPGLARNSIPIPDAAALAQRYLDDNDLRNVVIVAHSKGGLIGKHMMAVDDTEHRIARMVAITSPFSGSSIARYAPVRTLRAFMATDAVISTLAKNLTINSRITSIYGEFDPMIPARSYLEGATNIELPVIGHFRILADPVVLDAIVAAVDPDSLDPTLTDPE